MSYELDKLHETRRRAAQEALDQVREVRPRRHREPFDYKTWRRGWYARNKEAVFYARKLGVGVPEARRVLRELDRKRDDAVR